MEVEQVEAMLKAFMSLRVSMPSGLFDDGPIKPIIDIFIASWLELISTIASSQYVFTTTLKHLLNDMTTDCITIYKQFKQSIDLWNENLIEPIEQALDDAENDVFLAFTHLLHELSLAWLVLKTIGQDPFNATSIFQDELHTSFRALITSQIRVQKLIGKERDSSARNAWLPDVTPSIEPLYRLNEYETVCLTYFTRIWILHGSPQFIKAVKCRQHLVLSSSASDGNLMSDSSSHNVCRTASSQPASESEKKALSVAHTCSQAKSLGLSSYIATTQLSPKQRRELKQMTSLGVTLIVINNTIYPLASYSYPPCLDSILNLQLTFEEVSEGWEVVLKTRRETGYGVEDYHYKSLCRETLNDYLQSRRKAHGPNSALDHSSRRKVNHGIKNIELDKIHNSSSTFEHTLVERIVRHEDQLAKLQVDHTKLEKRTAELRKRNTELKREKAKLKETNAELNNHSTKWGKQNIDLERRNAKLKLDMDVLERQRERNSDLAEENTRLEEVVAGLEQQTQQNTDYITSLEEKCRTWQAKSDRQKEKIRHIEYLYCSVLSRHQAPTSSGGVSDQSSQRTHPYANPAGWQAGSEFTLTTATSQSDALSLFGLQSFASTKTSLV